MLRVQANDKGFKEELGQLVELEVWESAKDRAAEQLRATKDSLAAVSSRAATLAESEADLHRKVRPCHLHADVWQLLALLLKSLLLIAMHALGIRHRC